MATDFVWLFSKTWNCLREKGEKQQKDLIKAYSLRSLNYDAYILLKKNTFLFIVTKTGNSDLQGQFLSADSTVQFGVSLSASM